MEQSPSRQEVIELLADFVRGEVTEEDDKYIVTVTRRESSIVLHAKFSDIDAISEKLSGLEINDETALYSDSGYEIIVREESSGPMRRIREDKIEVQNEENGLVYDLSPASDEYLIWLLNEIKQNLSPRDFRLGFYYSPRIDRYLEEESEASLIDFIRLTSMRFLTLKIASDKKQSPSQFSKLTHAFLFHIGYNLYVALVPQRLLEEIARRGRITRMRRSRADEIDPPRRIYNEDLVQHYLLAVSTDNPVIEYLSYYHILEHFYEAVFNDDLLETIKSKITDPGFSYKRKKDIGLLINTIKRSLQIRSETITFSESEALRLCLSKYVQLPELISKLSEYDESLLDYYTTTKVEFSGGNEVDIQDADEEGVFKLLTRRIYSTRNALVHSKDSDKSKYTPFKDDRILVKEVPLMRFIAEMVVLKESVVQ